MDTFAGPIAIALGPLSKLQRRFVADLIRADQALTLVGEGAETLEALQIEVTRYRPDVVVLGTDEELWSTVAQALPGVNVIGIEPDGRTAVHCRGGLSTNDLGGLIREVAWAWRRRGSTRFPTD